MRIPRNFEQPLSKYAIMKFARPTFNTWMKLCPESNREQWKRYARPNALKDFADERLLSVFPGIYEGFSKLSIVVTFDEEYIVWLHGRKDTEWMQQEYINSLTTKDVVRLAQKNGFNNTYFVYAMPIPVSISDLRKRSYRELTRKTQCMLMGYLTNFTNNENVYVAPYLLDIKTIVDEEDFLIKMAKTYFKTNQQVEVMGWDMVEWDEFDEPPCFAIPIIFKYEHNEMIINPEQLMKNIPFKWNYRWVELLKENEIFERIKEDFGLCESIDKVVLQFAEIVHNESKSLFEFMKNDGQFVYDRRNKPIEIKNNECFIANLYQVLANDIEFFEEDECR